LTLSGEEEEGAQRKPAKARSFGDGEVKGQASAFFGFGAFLVREVEEREELRRVFLAAKESRRTWKQAGTSFILNEWKE